MKHLSIRELWVQEAIAVHEITVCKIAREMDIADALASPARSEHTFADAMNTMQLQCWEPEPEHT